MSDQIEKYKARANREKEARKQAEKILELKSRELYQSNLELKQLTKTLEQRVQERTSELQKAHDEAVKLAQVKSEFLANMSHELRTPLNGVLGVLTLLKNTELSNKQNKLVSTATNSGELLLALINDVLDFSKLDNDKLELEEIEFNPIELIQLTCEPFTSEAISKNIELIYLLSPDTPNLLRGDPTRIKQVITNLVSNALKFTKQGEVIISAMFDSNELTIAISDTGIGMTEEQLDKVLDKFSQANESTTRKYGGTGLGLSICKSLIDLMSGMLVISSEHGKGSCFEIRLPLKAANTEVSQTFPNNIGTQKVLLIFSHEQLLDYVETLLTHWTYDQVETTSSFDIAKELLDIDMYDVVIVGQKIQLETYEDVFQVIREHNTECQIISYWEAGTATKNQENHIMLHLPIKQSDLYDALVLKVNPEISSSVMDNIAAQGNYHNSPVLVVEDNLVNQQVIKELLSLFNCQIALANNGQEAIDKVQKDNFKLILMDIQMPVMDGITATQAIQELGGVYASLPIVALTAHNLPGDKDKSIAAGMQDHITKPIEINELKRVLNKYLEAEMNLEPEGIDIQNAGAKQYPGLCIEEAMERVLGNTDLYIRIAQEFTKVTKVHLQELKQALDNKDLEQLTRLAHTIKGSAANLSANDLSKLASDLESQLSKLDTIADTQMSEIQTQLDSLLTSSELVFNSIQSYLDDHS